MGTLKIDFGHPDRAVSVKVSVKVTVIRLNSVSLLVIQTHI